MFKFWRAEMASTHIRSETGYASVNTDMTTKVVVSNRRVLLIALLFGFVPLTACFERGDGEGLDTDFDIPRTESFASNLSSYKLYEDGDMGGITPAEGVHVYEISSELFTDYAKKQRLIKLPDGQSATILDDRRAEYPEGTVIAKTFFYLDDFRDPSRGKRVIETRLLVKTAGVWNVATYIWNDEQTDATLSLNGVTTKVNWISETGEVRSTDYEVPGEVACVTCHQNAGAVSLIGPSPRNLNRAVVRDEQELDQLTYLQSRAVFEQADPLTTRTMVDYKDPSHTLEDRARAYLDANCSHCHAPDAWDRSAKQGLDLRYETSLVKSGILKKRDKIERQMTNGEMPFVGTTLLHDEGVALVLDYLARL